MSSKVRQEFGSCWLIKEGKYGQVRLQGNSGSGVSKVWIWSFKSLDPKLGSRVTLDLEFQKSGSGVRLQGHSGSGVRLQGN